MFSKISFYTSYCNWRGSSSCRSSLAAGEKWFYALGQRVIGVFREVLQKPFLLCGLCALAEDFNLERQNISKQ